MSDSLSSIVESFGALCKISDVKISKGNFSHSFRPISTKLYEKYGSQGTDNEILRSVVRKTSFTYDGRRTMDGRLHDDSSSAVQYHKSELKIVPG